MMASNSVKSSTALRCLAAVLLKDSSDLGLAVRVPTCCPAAGALITINN